VKQENRKKKNPIKTPPTFDATRKKHKKIPTPPPPLATRKHKIKNEK